jgi:hypothetical protein
MTEIKRVVIKLWVKTNNRRKNVSRTLTLDPTEKDTVAGVKKRIKSLVDYEFKIYK